MNTKKISTKELKASLIRQGILPDGFIVRVQKIKEILREVETTSLEEAVSNFQRDLYPEMELKIWEKIAHSYELNINKNPNWNKSQRKTEFNRLFRITLGQSTG